MRIFTPLVIVAIALPAAGAAPLQITENPLPEPVEMHGLRAEVRQLARLPETQGRLPEDRDAAGFARVSFVRDAPDGRRFVNDSRGYLYILDADDRLTLYLDFAEALPFTAYNRLESGFIGFDFHPEFAATGLFYTVHGEYAPDNPARPDFIPPGFTLDDATYYNVITEWRASSPAADAFDGTRRELLRVAHVVDSLTHPFGYVGFNPTATPGDADYGLLYTSGSDIGFSNGAGPNAPRAGQLQRLDSVVGAILRIDPRSPSESGGQKGLGDYTIPPDNRFASDGDAETLGEIYAHGFRNAHRLSWDAEDGTLFATDIGMNHIEEVNIVRNGENYGWMQREGFFDNGINFPGGELDQLYLLPPDVLTGETEDGFTYPVAIYDHDEGRAISGGFAYRGAIEALRGKFVFGDIRLGRIFAADLEAMKAADDGVPTTVAPVEEVQLFVRDSDGRERDITFMELVEETNGAPVERTDLHISQSGDGELFLTSRQDGTVRMLVP